MKPIWHAEFNLRRDRKKCSIIDLEKSIAGYWIIPPPLPLLKSPLEILRLKLHHFN